MSSSGSGSASGVVSVATDYPSGDDLRARVEGMAAWASGALDGLAFDAKIAAAIRAFEGDTGYLPFLSSGVDSSRTFDPPNVAAGYGRGQGGGRRLYFNAGLVSLTTLNLSGTALTVDADFDLWPRDAASRSLPSLGIEFRGAAFGFGVPASVVVTGDWGYTVTLTGYEDVTEAILNKGLLLLYPDLSLLKSKGLYSARDLNFEIRFGGAGIMPLSLEQVAWATVYRDTVAGYRRSGF